MLTRSDAGPLPPGGPSWLRPLAAPLALTAIGNVASAPLRFLPKHFALEQLPLGDLGVVLSAGSIGEIAAIPAAALLTERAPRAAMSLGALLQAAGLAGFALRGLGLPGLVGACAVARVGVMLVFTSLFTAVAAATPPERGAQGIALYWGTVQIARNVAGPSATEWLMDAVGFRHAAALFGAVALAGAAAAWAPAARAPAARAAAGAPAERPRDPAALAHFSIVFFLLGLVFVAQDGFLTSYAVERGFAIASPIFVAYGGVMLVSRLFFGHVPDRYGKAPVLHASVLALVAFFVALLLVRSAPLFWATGVLAGLGNALLWPALYAVSFERIRTKAYATAWTSLLLSGSGALGGLVFGAVAERSGHRGIYAGAIGLCLLVSLLLLVPRRSAPAAPRSAS